MLRVASPLSPELEQLVSDTIGCCIRVHAELGPGLLEAIYLRAVCAELAACGITFDREKPIPIYYRGDLLCQQRLDLMIDGRLIVELKSVERFHPVHQAQLLGYMRAAGVKVGLLMNFNSPTLRVRRFVL